MKGRPVLGAISGLLFGVFLVLDLHMLRVWPLSSASEIVLPLGGLVLGIVVAMAAPFGGRKDSETE